MAIDTSEWTKEDLLREARLQTEAIQRLDAWMRLGYSAIAIGFLAGWWGFYGQGATWAGVLGMLVLLIGAAVSFILKVGTSRARKNVENILAAAKGQEDSSDK